SAGASALAADSRRPGRAKARNPGREGQCRTTAAGGKRRRRKETQVRIFSCLPFSCLTLRPTGKWKTGKYPHGRIAVRFRDLSDHKRSISAAQYSTQLCPTPFFPGNYFFNLAGIPVEEKCRL